jgi:uncharacterized PurR-regulated membrane protein YhhQ (DUF165 family)
MNLAVSFIYILALVVANLTVAKFGLAVVYFNAILFIGLDLVLRDWLQARLSRKQMGALIAVAGAVTYAMNPQAGDIAFASAAAFTLAALADWAVFSRLRGSWLLRSNASNVAGAAVDSVVFPTIAFHSLMPEVVLGQFAAKVIGGAVWSWLLRKRITAAA